jgi:3-oxoacyl-[acyl-carrier protein] reductase
MLGRSGARVVLAGRQADALEQVASEIRAAGGEAAPVPTDVSREADVLRLFTEVKRQFDRLDVLVNNAGIGIFGEVAEASAADFDRMYQVNARGTFLCCREALKLMAPRRRGYIINLSSVMGFRGYPNQAGYVASKHAVTGLTKSLAVEAQPHGIRVSLISPGGVDTGMVAEARPDLDRSVLLEPDDIAQAVAYLLSLSDRAAVDEIYIRRRSSTPG